MARKRTARKTPSARTSGSGGRGSAEAIEKRRAARQLNALLSGGSKGGRRLDGRTEKRRQRLIRELKEGRAGRGLKPIDFVSHVNELLDLGESLGSLRRAGVKARRVDGGSEIHDVISRTQHAYGFRPEAWRMLGVEVGAAETERGGRSRRAADKRRR